jgi:hypothetical protein
VRSHYVSNFAADARLIPSRARWVRRRCGDRQVHSGSDAGGNLRVSRARLVSRRRPSAFEKRRHSRRHLTVVATREYRAPLIASIAADRPRRRSSVHAARVSSRIARLRRWEFWPSWVIHAPVVAWIGGLALYHRGLTVFTAANPGIEEGGFVGESKSAILARLPQTWVIPWAVLEPAPLSIRITALDEMMRVRGWSYPLVIKPDVGQRGTGVRWLHRAAEAERYLEREPRRVLLQIPHPGPGEAGLFYVRVPGAARGRLFSVTEKRFPVLIGNGRSTIEALILSHQRARLQARVFFTRHAAQLDRIPATGEVVPLVRAGNHAQGAQFFDGSWLATPALEARIDEIARAFPGFYFGRFDVRYAEAREVMAGRGFAIVELNGVTSEATHIYDPSGSLIDAWRTLMRQWSMAFAVGAANRARGHRPATLRRLLSLISAYATLSSTHPVAD